jgi:hypothetical protein
MTAIETHRRALMHIAEETNIQLIPIEEIRVLNPRARNKQVFARLVENISALGLKRPITVARALRNRLCPRSLRSVAGTGREKNPVHRGKRQRSGSISDWLS